MLIQWQLNRIRRPSGKKSLLDMWWLWALLYFDNFAWNVGQWRWVFHWCLEDSVGLLVQMLQLFYWTITVKQSSTYPDQASSVRNLISHIHFAHTFHPYISLNSMFNILFYFTVMALLAFFIPNIRRRSSISDQGREFTQSYRFSI